jgi:hypothetical protein
MDGGTPKASAIARALLIDDFLATTIAPAVRQEPNLPSRSRRR